MMLNVDCHNDCHGSRGQNMLRDFDGDLKDAGKTHTDIPIKAKVFIQASAHTAGGPTTSTLNHHLVSPFRNGGKQNLQFLAQGNASWSGSQTNSKTSRCAWNKSFSSGSSWNTCQERPDIFLVVDGNTKEATFSFCRFFRKFSKK